MSDTRLDSKDTKATDRQLLTSTALQREKVTPIRIRIISNLGAVIEVCIEYKGKNKGESVLLRQGSQEKLINDWCLKWVLKEKVFASR